MLEEGEIAVNASLRTVPEDAIILEDGQKAVDADAVILEDGQQIIDANDIVLQEGQKAVNANAIILENGQIAVPENSLIVEEIQGRDASIEEQIKQLEKSQIIETNSSGSGADAPGNSFTDHQLTGQGAGEGEGILAMTLGEGPGQSDGNGEGAGQSNSSGSGEGEGESQLAQEVNEFIQGDGDGGSEDVESRGQGASGQGQGMGGEAALGEDQSPTTQRKRGLMLQPLMEEENLEDKSKTPSTLLKNLSEGSVMGNNLLDALALGAGVLYALYAPKAVDAGKKGWRKLFNKIRQRANGGDIPIAEKNVLSVFAMKMPNGSERLMATRVDMGGMEVLAQQDLPSDVSLGEPGSDTQIDYGVSQLLAKLEGKNFDLALIGPKLQNQSPLIQALAKESQLLNTKSLISRLSNCSSSDIEALQKWLNKPRSTPPESSPVYDLLQERQKRYGNELAKEQASMSSLIELSVAMGWSQYDKAA